MFFSRRKRYRYNGDVATFLPAFGFSMEEAGVFGLLNVLDIAWAQKYSVYEAALLVAYSFAAGLYKRELVERADTFIKDNLLPIQQDWINKGIVRAELVSLWPEKLAKRAAAARGQV